MEMKNFCELKELLRLMGFTLVGSRAIGLNEKDSDWDFMTTDEKAYERIVCMLSSDNILDIKYGEPYQITEEDPEFNWLYAHFNIRSTYYPKQKFTFFNEKVHICLVDKILSREEQICLHNQKSERKIEVISEFLLKNSLKIAEILSKNDLDLDEYTSENIEKIFKNI